MKKIPQPIYTGAVIIMFVVAAFLAIKSLFDETRQPPVDTSLDIQEHDEHNNSHVYLTSVDTQIPGSSDVLSIEVYTDSIVPTIHGPSTGGEAQMRQFDITFGEGVADLMNTASYDETTNKIILGDNFISLPPEDVVRIEDVNFDGRPDLGILNGVGYGGVNLYYGYYMNTKIADSSDPTTNDILGDFIKEEELQDVANPTIHPETKMITSSFRSGPEWYSQSWQYENGVLVDKGEVKGSD